MIDSRIFKVFKQIRGGFQGDDFIGNFDEGGIQLQDIWHALLNTKEGTKNKGLDVIILHKIILSVPRRKYY